MTERQAQFLSFIHRYTIRRGVAPSFEEIATHFGISPPSVNSMIKTLERNGFLSRIPGASRTLRVEVPAHLLPDGEFGSPATGRRPARDGEPQVSAVDVGVAVGVSIVDCMARMALEAGQDKRTVTDGIVAAAQAAREAATQAGLGTDDATEVGRRIGAEVARWQEHGRGVVIPNRVWTRRNRPPL